MKLFILALGLAYLAGVLKMIVAARKAPRGFEDAQGFHLGNPPTPAPEAHRLLDAA